MDYIATIVGYKYNIASRTVYNVVSVWLDPNYLDYWPFEIITEKAILMTPLEKKTSEMRIFSFSQGIVRYAGRANWCLVISIQQLQHRAEKRISQMRIPVRTLIMVHI